MNQSTVTARPAAGVAPSSTDPLTRPWPVRAVQLDLARQMETLPQIHRFIRHAADWGYNTLFLYLEGVIRTEHFPWRPKNETYTPQEMQQVVAWAQQAGLEVVPCVATLGHAENFVQCPELAHLAETGRPFPGGHMFCPSNPRTYEFLENYLKDLLAIFPSSQVSIGGDEAWRIGACPACAKRREAGEGIPDIFLAHVQTMHAMLARHGKRLWMWDDLLEYASDEKIATLPRDIVMCHWGYSADAYDYGGTLGHFNGQRRRDWLRLYGDLGFDVLICPGATCARNVVRSANYARQHAVMGGIQTIWELSNRHLLQRYANVALAGHVWRHPQQEDDAAIEAVIGRLIPGLDETETQAVMWMMTGLPPARQRRLEGYLSGLISTHESRDRVAAQLVAQTLAPVRDRLDAGLARDLVEDMVLMAREVALCGQVRRLASMLVDPRVPLLHRQRLGPVIDACRQEVASLTASRQAQWPANRGELDQPDKVSAAAAAILEPVEPWLQGYDKPLPADHALLDLTLFLRDNYAACRLTIEMRQADGQWVTLARDQVYKPANLQENIFTQWLPIQWPESAGVQADSAPVELRFSARGFGGQGVLYVAIHGASASLRPTEVLAQEGQVEHAQALLVDDAASCYLGSDDTCQSLLDFTEDEVSSVTIRLSPSTIAPSGCFSR